MSNKVSIEEAERLELLIEECGEVIQIAYKVLRHGYDSYHPTGNYDNRQELEKELGDVVGIMRLMNDNGDVLGSNIDQASDSKIKRLPLWLHHKHKMPELLHENKTDRSQH